MSHQPIGPSRILFVTTSLGGGGAEKHLVRVANHLDRERFTIAIAVARGGGSFETELRDDTTTYDLGAGGMRRAIPPLRRLLARLKPHVLCSVMDIATSASVLAQVNRRRAALVGCVQVPPTIEFAQSGRAGRMLRALLPYVYRHTDQLVAISEGVARDVMTVEPRARNRTTVIYNAGWDDALQELSTHDIDPPSGADGRPIIMACGRLTRQKGFSDLLKALVLVRKHVPAHLWLVGEGELRLDLERQARDLSLGDCVWFAGFQTNPYALMRRSDVFVLSSLYEGFGNVIVEAMSVDTPVVSTACPYGPDEIITSGKDGLLVPPADPEALACAILDVLRQPNLRKGLVGAGRRRADDFSAKAIAAAYGDLFSEVANRDPRGAGEARG